VHSRRIGLAKTSIRKHGTSAVCEKVLFRKLEWLPREQITLGLALEPPELLLLLVDPTDAALTILLSVKLDSSPMMDTIGA
jgi:hypothetical protein